MPFWGKALIIDLSGNRVQVEDIPSHVFRKYLGGVGLGAWFIYNYGKRKIHPLSDEAFIGFVPGLLCGTGIPFSSRWFAVAKSPLTGMWGESSCGGYFGSSLKRAGFDALFIKGKAEKPVYILIDKDVEIKDASSLWGRDAVETEGILKDKHPGFDVIAIGISGEKKLPISSIVHDGGRALGRCGLGAVMGSKNLKAIAVKGEKELKLHDPDKAMALSLKIKKLFPEKSFLEKFLALIFPLLIKIGALFGKRGAKIQSILPPIFYRRLFKFYGTSLGLYYLYKMKDAPTKNWTWDKFPAHKISDRALLKYRVGRKGCYGCPVKCMAVSYLDGEKKEPTYEVLASLGTNILNHDLERIIRAYDVCNRYGIDVIEVGNLIGMLMEGEKLKWGELDPELMRKIGEGEGIGEVLSKGVREASRALGIEGIEIKGQSPGMHSPYFTETVTISYLLSPAPSRHTSGNLIFENFGAKLPLKWKGDKIFLWNYYFSLLNSLGICLFTINLKLNFIKEALNVLEGWDVGDEELLQIGKEIERIRHLINIEEGIDPLNYNIPKRLKRGEPSEFIKRYLENLGIYL